jgi:serine/threonine protein kinase
MYDFFLSSPDTPFDVVRTMRRSERSELLLLRHKKSGNCYVYRVFTGGGEVYRRLVPAICPNLPRIYDVAEEAGRTAVLEEFIRGDSLQDLLADSTLSSQDTRGIARDLCQALHVLHSLGAVHRDVKPENIILRGDTAVLVDFDASRVMKREQRKDTVVLGTMGFAAPEQYGLSQTDGRADIYSLGVLINYMLTGKHPSRELAEGRWRRIVSRCTAMSPQERYQSVEALMEDL